MNYCSVLSRILIISTCIILTGCKVDITTENSVKIEDSTPEPLPDIKGPVRIMGYNIQNFGPEAIGHGDRINRLKDVIADIKPTIVGVQEVADRDAMKLIFAPQDWLIIIDDDSIDKQDTAFAVRKPWKVTNIANDLDADDPQFLAEGRENESFFPNRRDALFINVESPDGRKQFTVVNIHAKARRDGRDETEHRRIGASRVLLKKFQTDLKGQKIVLLGDFNDTPDDASLNVLETGNPNARGEMENNPDTFMMNLMEPLWGKNMVTHGASAKRLDKKTGHINNVYPEARTRNDNTRGRAAGSGPVMFDQILISQNMAELVNRDSVSIYTNPKALDGTGFARPSDHLPVYVDLK